jgi:hypothetical protein
MVEDPESKRGFRTFTVRGWIVEMLTEDGAGRNVTRSDPDAFVFVTPDGSPLHYNNCGNGPGFRQPRLPGSRVALSRPPAHRGNGSR